MAKAECSVCVWEKATGRKVILDSKMSKTAWARFIEVSEASVRRHFRHVVADAANAPEPDAFLAEYGIPSSVVTSRGMSVRDPESGSWQKVSWQPNAKALSDTLQYDDLKQALDGWVPESVTFMVSDSGKTAILNASDLQIGKALQRGGGTPETVERVRKSFQAFADYLIESGITQAVIIDGGDPIENVWNTPGQLVTNDLPVPEQIRVFRRLMLEGIKLIAPLVSSLIYVSVPSNHGQARTGYKAVGGTVDADFGLEVSYQLEDAIGENPYLTHVSFIRPEPLDETAVVEVSNTKIAVHHGHQSSGANGHGRWWATQSHGRMAGWDADILQVAHYHSLRVEQSGNGRWIIVASSSDASSDWFTNRTGESALQGMTAYDVLDGQWSNLRIL